MHLLADDKIEDSVTENLRYSIEETGADLRAEVIVSGLVRRGVPIDQIIIHSKSNSQRPYRKEVSSFFVEVSDYDNKEYLFLRAHRDGLYDALPQNIFHQPTRGKTEKNKEEVIDEIIKHREEEKEARKFFLPIEQEYNYIKAILNNSEEDFEKNTENSKLINIFSRHWPILEKLDTYHAYIFLRIIPLIHSIRNNFELSSRSMSLILGVNISIVPHKTIMNHSALPAFKLGEGALGIDSIVGTTANDGENDLKVNVGPLPSDKINAFLSGGKYETIIEELIGYFFSANYNYCKEITVAGHLNEFSLNENKTILGINSYI